MWKQCYSNHNSWGSMLWLVLLKITLVLSLSESDIVVNNTCENCCVRNITDYLFMVTCMESNEKCKSISSNTLYFILTCGHVESFPHVESNFFNYTPTNSLFYLYFYYFILTFFFSLLISLFFFVSPLLISQDPPPRRDRQAQARFQSSTTTSPQNQQRTEERYGEENRGESTEKEKKWKREKEIGQNEKRKKKNKLK